PSAVSFLALLDTPRIGIDERIADSQRAEAREVPVSSPQDVDSVLDTDRRDPRIVDSRSDDPAGADQLPKRLPISRILRRKGHRRRLDPGIDLSDCYLQAGRRAEDARVGHYGEE